MPDIILPRRPPGLTTRRRSVDPPSAADVPTVDPTIARDPGLNVPAGAFGSGIPEALQSISKAIPDVVRAIERQTRLRDATSKAKARDDVLSALREGFQSRARDQDFADDEVREDFTTFVNDTIGGTRDRLKEQTGLSRLSDEALASFDLELDEIGNTFRDQGDSLHLMSLEKRGVDRIAETAAEAARLARETVTLEDDPAIFLSVRLELFDQAMEDFSGALQGGKEQDLRRQGRRGIVEAAVTGLAEQGQGKEALALLDNPEFVPELDQDTRNRLKRNTVLLADAHEKDRFQAEKREAAEQAREQEQAALAFTTGFRSRLVEGTATLADIAQAETGGILSPGRADRLRDELTADELRRDDVAARAGRITTMLEAGDQPDPPIPDDRADVTHHCDVVLRPALADMDPAQKAEAISVYVEDTGIAPEATLDTLLGLAVTGESQDRIAAARALIDLLRRDPAARNRVPPPLIEFAEFMRSLTETDTIPAEDMVKLGDLLIRDAVPNAPEDGPDPGLTLLARARSDFVANQLVTDLDRGPTFGAASSSEVVFRAELLADLTEIDPRTPEEIVRDVDALFSTGSLDPNEPDATTDQAVPEQQIAQRGGRRGRTIFVRPPSGPPRETPKRALNSRQAREARNLGTIRGWARDYQVPRITVQKSEHFTSSGAAWLHGFRQLLKASNGKSLPERIAPNKWRSPDGRWQLRLDQGRRNNHFNLERIDPVSGFVIRNTHLRFPE